MFDRRPAVAGLAALLAAGSAAADVPEVATDIAPVHSLAARVMDGLGAPALVVRPGASPHGYAMRPSEARALQDADAVFWIGPALAPWMEDAIANLAPDAAVTALLDAPETRTLAFRTGATFAPHDHEDHGEAAHAHGGEPGHDDEHGHEANHEEGHDHDHDHEAHDGDGHDHEAHHEEGHDHAGTDPHAWLDPENAKAWLSVIAGTLSDLDPANAETYATNAADGRAEIDAAVARATDTLASAADLRFVVFHDAYQYYETRFGLNAAGAIELADASAPSPARIEEVRETVESLGVDCIFSEPQFNPDLVVTVADGTGARAGIVDPLGMEIATGPGFYPRLLTNIADEIASCTD